MNSVIGALRAVLGMDSTAFEQGVGTAQKQLNSLNKSFQKTARDLDKLGSAMSIAITAPIVAAATVMSKSAGDFEEGMNKVRAATGATADEMSKMTAMAKEVGKSSGFGAKDTASAMEALAKNGLNVTQILNGATEATVKLAAANGAQLEPAANVVTDVMQQFGKTTGELPGVVNQVTGTLIASKLGFDDYRLAIGQAGGVAGKLGVSFEDFNAALAATSSSFASGSDAGTSFKTFLTRLVPQSDEAKDAMKALGLTFFDSKGAMVSMEEQAARLQKALKGLSDKSKTDLVSKIFGTDAMRTALSLAEQGAEGIKKMRAEIDKTSASAQAAVRIEGLNGALRKLSASYEALAIAIGESGLLEAATKLVTWASDMLNKIAALPPQVLKLATSIAGAAAAIGPLLVAGAAIISWLGQLAVWVGRAIPALAPIAALLTPWLAAALAVAAAAAAILLFGDNVKFAAGGAVTLNDMLRALISSLSDLQNTKLLKWLTDLNDNVMPAVEGTSSLGQALKDVLSQDLSTWTANSIKELDAITNAFTGAYNVITTAWSQIGPVFDEIMDAVSNSVQAKVRDMLEGMLEKINWLREKVGADPWPPLPPANWQKDNEGNAARAAEAIANAWNNAFTKNFFSEAYQKIAAEGLTNALNRMIGDVQLPPVVVSADFLPKPTPKPTGNAGRNVTTPDSKDKALAEALKRIEEEKKALDAAAAFLKTSGAASETLLFQAADEVARIGAKTADMLKGLDPNSATAQKILADVTALEKARTAYTQLQDAIKTAFATEAQWGNGIAVHAETMRLLNEALATGRLSQDAYAAAVVAANDALTDQTNKAAGAKGGVEGFAAGMSDAAEQMARANRPFEQGRAAFGELTSAFTDAGKGLLQLDADVGTILSRLLQRLADFALETLLMKPLFEAIGSMIKNAYSGGSSGGGGILSSIIGGIGSIFGGGTAAGSGTLFEKGGRPAPGVPYIVGEKGPELRVDGPGTIIPNAKSMRLAGAWYAGASGMGMAPKSQSISAREAGGWGSQTNVVQHLNFALGVVPTVRAEIRRALPDIAKAGAAAAQSLRQRGGSFKESWQPQ